MDIVYLYAMRASDAIKMLLLSGANIGDARKQSALVGILRPGAFFRDDNNSGELLRYLVVAGIDPRHLERVEDSTLQEELKSAWKSFNRIESYTLKPEKSVSFRVFKDFVFKDSPLPQEISLQIARDALHKGYIEKVKKYLQIDDEQAEKFCRKKLLSRQEAPNITESLPTRPIRP